MPVMTTPIMTESDLREAVARELPGVRADLERLVRIPGIAFDGFDHAHVERSAEAVAELLRGCGLDVEVARAGGQPAVIGRRAAPPGAPTVMLYAHHDVQPIGDPTLWESDPFEPVERDGRLYGRGAADDKAGIMAHVAALRAFGDRLPVGVVVFVEGEEEYGSDSLERLLAEHRDKLTADVIVIADSTNWDVGVPALTTSLRGIVNCFVEVRTLDHAVHSGMFGGAVPDALTTLVRLLATLHDDAGNVAVADLVGREAARVDYPEDRFRAEAGLADGVRLFGTGRITDRLCHRRGAERAGSGGQGQAQRTAGAGRRTEARVRGAPRPSGAARTVGRTGRGDLRARRCPLRHRRQRPDVRRGPIGLPDRVGRHRRGGDRGRWLHSVHRHLPGDVPAGGDPGDGGGGPARPCPRTEREPAPRRVRPGLPRRGVVAGRSG